MTVAVLLDAFVSARAESKRTKEMTLVEEAGDRVSAHNALDPLMERLTREYVDDDDLTERLQKLYLVRVLMAVVFISEESW